MLVGFHDIHEDLVFDYFVFIGIGWCQSLPDFNRIRRKEANFGFVTHEAWWTSILKMLEVGCLLLCTCM